MLRNLGKILFAALFIFGGIAHFTMANKYIPMIPDGFPNPELLVSLSGIAEFALGVTLLIPRFSQLAAWGLIALLIAVFPANINMAAHHERFANVPEMFLYIRLPLQGLLIAWAWVYTKKRVTQRPQNPL